MKQMKQMKQYLFLFFLFLALFGSAIAQRQAAYIKTQAVPAHVKSTNDKLAAINSVLDARLQRTVYKVYTPRATKRYTRGRKTHPKGKRALLATPNEPSINDDDTQGWNLEYLVRK